MASGSTPFHDNLTPNLVTPTTTDAPTNPAVTGTRELFANQNSTPLSGLHIHAHEEDLLSVPTTPEAPLSVHPLSGSVPRGGTGAAPMDLHS